MKKIMSPTLTLRSGLAVSAAAIAVAFKLILTNGSLLPGVDGAYYWVQVRSILEDLSLAFDDLPLVFYLQALFSLAVGDIKLGVRISDAVLPALAAIPIYLMLKKSKQVWLPAVAILAVLLHPVQLYFFTGDFIKNAAAIPVAFFIGWILFTWDNRAIKLSIAGLVVCLAIVGLTHFGTLLLCIFMLALWAIFYLRKKPVQFWLTSGIVALGVGALTVVTLAVLVPSRFERLVEFVTQPATIFEGPFWQFMFLIRTDVAIIFAVFAGQICSLALGFLLWKNRAKLENSAFSLAASSLVTAFLLSSPLVGIEWASRFIALSFAPLFLAAIVLWHSTDRAPLKVNVSALALSTIVISLLLAPSGAKPSAVTDIEYRDLVVASKEFAFPDNSIVVARHGLEFLVAWEMKTYVIQEETYLEEDLSSYGSVYLLSTDSSAGYGGYNAYDKPPAGKSETGKPPTGKVPIDKLPSKGKGGQEATTGELVYAKGKVTITKIR